jgi:hypothetical protein
MNMQFVGFLTMHIRSRNVDMHGYIERELLETVLSDLKIFPVLALFGARQVGKSTLAKIIAESRRITFLELNPFSPSECTVDKANFRWRTAFIKSYVERDLPLLGLKAPRIYIRDTGIAWMLLGIGNANDMMAHPGWGAMWEALVVENEAVCIRVW